jgi:hypothetical protein
LAAFLHARAIRAAAVRHDGHLPRPRIALSSHAFAPTADRLHGELGGVTGDPDADSANATIVQHTIQLIQRLPDPTPVTAVLVEENTMVKKDQPLFQFDRRPFEYQVQHHTASDYERSRASLSGRASVEGQLPFMRID